MPPADEPEPERPPAVATPVSTPLPDAPQVPAGPADASSPPSRLSPATAEARARELRRIERAVRRGDLPKSALAEARRRPAPAAAPPVGASGGEASRAAASAAAVAPSEPDAPAAERQAAGRGIARNTAIFSIATGASRIMGLVREVVARSYFGTTGAASAFTLAFQIPNLVRGLFADAALSAAFVPVFTELLEQDRRKDAFELASTLFFCIVAALGAITAVFILGAGVIMPLFTGGKFTPELTDLTVGLSRVLFPIVLLLGVNGLVVGILNAYGRFSTAALSPLAWNLVIIAALVLLHGAFTGDDRLYAYAIGVLAGTIVQLVMVLPGLARLDFRLTVHFDYRDPRVRQVFALMLPVTIGLGIINFDLIINSGLGTLISDQAPSAIDAAFRIYMLPQGMFSVAIATVLFPALSRLAARRDLDGLRATMSTGIRQIALTLIPAAVFSAVLAEAITRLVYQRGEFDHASTERVRLALFWFSFSLPFSGANLLLTRTFFSLQKPWLPTSLAAGSLVVNAIVSLALYRPFGIAGPVIGTAVASLAMAVAQAVRLRRLLGGDLEEGRTAAAVLRIAAASALLGVVAWLVHGALEEVLGLGLLAQLISVGAAALIGLVAYLGAVLALEVDEARDIERRLLARVRVS